MKRTKKDLHAVKYLPCGTELGATTHHYAPKYLPRKKKYIVRCSCGWQLSQNFGFQQAALDAYEKHIEEEREKFSGPKRRQRMKDVEICSCEESLYLRDFAKRFMAIYSKPDVDWAGLSSLLNEVQIESYLAQVEEIERETRFLQLKGLTNNIHAIVDLAKQFGVPKERLAVIVQDLYQ